MVLIFKMDIFNTLLYIIDMLNYFHINLYLQFIVCHYILIPLVYKNLKCKKTTLIIAI